MWSHSFVIIIFIFPHKGKIHFLGVKIVYTNPLEVKHILYSLTRVNITLIRFSRVDITCVLFLDRVYKGWGISSNSINISIVYMVNNPIYNM